MADVPTRPLQVYFHWSTGLTHPISGIKAKVENQGQYDEYLNELQGIREELGVNLKEQMYPETL